VLLSRAIHEALLAQAVAELPNECCGLLAAAVSESDPPRVVRVEQHYPLVNAAASPLEYVSDARSMFEAVRDMRRRGLDVVGVYHSHPTSEPVPSRKDLQRNYSPDVVNFIISLKDGTPRIRGWWLTAEGYREAEWEVGD
jgi:proteasome lid subunit RPN8/RPN11